MSHVRLRTAFRSPPAWIALVGLMAASFGCANGEVRLGDPFDRKYTLEEVQHRYTVLVRWAEFQKAREFVAKDDRDAFMDRMNALSEARFTDYESESVELDDEKQKATIRVVYTLYLASSPYETEVTEIQEWTRDGVTNSWSVLSTFEGLPDVAAN